MQYIFLIQVVRNLLVSITVRYKTTTVTVALGRCGLASLGLRAFRYINGFWVLSYKWRRRRPQNRGPQGL